MDYTTALYYTFSTIAQTLGAAIALLGAFVLFRLQSLNAEMEGSSELLWNMSGGEHFILIRNAHFSKQFGEVLRHTNDAAAFYGKHEEAMRIRALLHDSWENRNSLMRWFLLTLILTVGLIFFSVVILSFVPRIQGVGIIFALGLAWFLLCLISCAILVKKAVG